METIASRYAIQSKHLYELSPQQLVSCDYDPSAGLEGCSGGEICSALSALVDVSTYWIALFLDFTALEREHLYTVRDWYRFSCKHAVIEIQPKVLEQKLNILLLFNQLCIQRSLCTKFVLWYLDTCSKLPATFDLFPFWAFGYAHVQLRSYYSLSTLRLLMWEKHQALHTWTCTTSMFALQSGEAWNKDYLLNSYYGINQVHTHAQCTSHTAWRNVSDKMVGEVRFRDEFWSQQ